MIKTLKESLYFTDMESNEHIKLFQKSLELACHIIERSFGQPLESECNCWSRANKKAGTLTLQCQEIHFAIT